MNNDIRELNFLVEKEKEIENKKIEKNENIELDKLIDGFKSLDLELKDNHNKSLNKMISFGEFNVQNYEFIDNNTKIRIPINNSQNKEFILEDIPNNNDINIENQNEDSLLFKLNDNKGHLLEKIIPLKENQNQNQNQIQNQNQNQIQNQNQNQSPKKIFIKNYSIKDFDCKINSNSKIILLIKDASGNNYDKIIPFKIFNSTDNTNNNESSFIKLKLDENDIKVIRFNEFNNYNVDNNTIIENPLEIRIIIINSERNIFERIINICSIKLEKYIEKDIFDEVLNIGDSFKIKMTIKDNQNNYVTVFYYLELLRFCKNSKDFFEILQNNYIKEDKAKLIESNTKFKFKINLPKIEEYIIIIKKEDQNCCTNVLNNIKKCYECCNCWKCFCSCCLIRNIISLGIVVRFLFQIGDIYFSFILLGIHLQTSAILITASQVFMTGWWWILEFYLLFYVSFFINFINLFPLSMQFWETLKFRYIKEKNPFIILLRIFKKDNIIDEENKKCENYIDFICFIFFLLLVIFWLFVYNKSPIPFEILNLFIFIIIPLAKFLFLFVYNYIIGICTIYNRIKNNKEAIKEMTDFKIFENKLEFNQPDESYNDLEPIRLLMNGEENNQLNYSDIKFLYIICGFLLPLLSYSIQFKSISFFIYFLIFYILMFPMSYSVPLNKILFYCFEYICCKKYCCKKEVNIPITENRNNIEKKFKGLNCLLFSISFLINIYIFMLIIIAAKIDDSEYASINDRLGNEKNFNESRLEDFTEQSFARNNIKNSMCSASVYNLNIIQLVSLAQASYINNDDDIQRAKDVFYSSTIFKNSNINIKKMEFLSKGNDNIVLLRTDFEFKNSDRNLIVISIRGSTSFRDWWLDLEMYSSSAIFSLMKMIPLILKDESIQSEAIKFFLTLPLNMMEDITLLRYYSKTVYDKVDNIIKENNNSTDFIFVGHSLGGGLSKYVATHYQMQSFSVSGPGISPLEFKHKEIFGYNKYFKSSFIDIIPDNDIVPRFEISGGIKYRVLCDKNSITCHSVDRTLCMIGIICQQEEYTKKLCLSMPNIGEENYIEMKELKNGKNFCENFILDSEKDKDKCKTAEITNEDSKCCYVHLTYPGENGQAHDYKCLQFKEDEKQRYKEALNKKYSDYKLELEC